MTEQKRKPLPLTELTALTTLDGRNRADVVELAFYVSEFGIIRTRVEVEAKYLVALSEVGVVRPLTKPEKTKLMSFGDRFSLSDAKKIKKIEEETDHDVKAMEKAFREMLSGTSMEDLIEKVHFGLTSEDINNITYRLVLKRVTKEVFLPVLDGLVDDLLKRANDEKETPMLARTHGQPAVPTTLGHEIAVFARRLNKQVRSLEDYPLEAKLTGAIGNLNALKDSYPDIDWITFSENFLRSLGFDPNLITTQIAPYEDVIEYFQHYSRINGIVLDLDQDAWRYISDDWFTQELKENEVGSSTMPQKINPIKFENSEGNLGKSTALFEFDARKLPVSRLSRDLSDSTVIRDMGAPLGWSLLAYKNTRRGLLRISPNVKLMTQILNEDWSILAEAAQTRMRRFGVDDPYSIVKKLTRGKQIGRKEWIGIVDQLPLSDEEKKDLKRLTPEKYIGLAVELTEKAVEEINSSRKTIH
ncbi:MAG: adenylosuccinate lyase [Candidatus Levybacteria bacterium]|nr:adenylosuccinate lyase [Candidatus Levybacteria bacterium]